MYSTYRSSPFRSTVNPSYITGLDMCKVCTEAVHSVALCPEKNAQTPKRGNGKVDRNRARGVFQGGRTSRSARVYIYIYTCNYIYVYRKMQHPSPPTPPKKKSPPSGSLMLFLLDRNANDPPIIRSSLKYATS